MKKSDIKDYMIVETGFDECRYLVMGKSIVDDELKGFSIDDFDENLVHKKEKPYSISKVYEAVKITLPFELNVEDIFAKQNPKLLWKREASRPVTAVIMAIFATREHHWAATLPAMYFLLSLTVPISLLLIIIILPPQLFFYR